jgi:hypothetical protein
MGLGSSPLGSTPLGGAVNLVTPERETNAYGTSEFGTDAFGGGYANIPPPIPTGLTATPGTNLVSLSWDASINTLTYHLYRDGVQIADLTGTTFLDTGLASATTYTYTVRSWRGRESADSASVSPTTSAATGDSAGIGSDSYGTAEYGLGEGSTTYVQNVYVLVSGLDIVLDTPKPLVLYGTGTAIAYTYENMGIALNPPWPWGCAYLYENIGLALSGPWSTPMIVTRHSPRHGCVYTYENITV